MRHRLTPLRGRRVLSALALCALLFALPSPAALPYRKAPGGTQPAGKITFAVIGDFGAAAMQSSKSAEKQVADLVNGWSPDFIITVGDNNYPCGAQETFKANVGDLYGKYVGKSIDANKFFPTLGNHDYALKTCETSTACAGNNEDAPQSYLDYFTLPGNERYYNFQRGPVEFFALNSNCNEPDGITSYSAQGQWLKAKLAASTARYKIVYFHNPPYSSGEHGPSTAMQWPFQKWGATAVITGHEHSYERLYKSDPPPPGVERSPNDTLPALPYIINGSGGVPLRTFSADKCKLDAGSLCRNATDNGALKVVADSNSISFEFISATDVGKVRDYCYISGTGGSIEHSCSGRRRECPDL